MLNSFSLSGKIIDNISDPALASTSRVITPVFKPIGVHEDNWQAVVGSFTDAMTKEMIVGTLNTLYTAESIQGEEFNPADFHLGDKLLGAINETWQNLRNVLNLGVLVSPVEANKSSGEVATGAMGVMGEKFGSAAAACSHLVSVLPYVPCTSVVGAIVRESSRGQMSFLTLWGLDIVYSLLTLFYRTVSYKEHPTYNLVCILTTILFNIALLSPLRRVRSHVDLALPTTNRAASFCCSSMTGDCH